MDHPTSARNLLPYPTGLLRLAMRAPVWSYRLGLCDLAGIGTVLVLTTRGRKSGLPRYAPLEFRRHGSKYYIVSAWGTRPDWYQNLLAHPQATIRQGRRIQTVRATTVTDPAEALRVLNMFRRTLPFIYDRVLATMSHRPVMNLDVLADVAGHFTVVRLDVVEEPALLPAVRADRGWLFPVALAFGASTLAVMTLARGRETSGG